MSVWLLTTRDFCGLVGDQHITRGSIFIIGGAPGVGKSRAAVALAEAGATSHDWFGLKVHSRFKTLIVQNENGLRAVTFRTSLEGRSTHSVGRESIGLKRSVRVHVMEFWYKLRRTDRGWHQWEMACFTDREVEGQFVTRLERFKIGGERPPVEISFRNLI